MVVQEGQFGGNGLFVSDKHSGISDIRKKPQIPEAADGRGQRMEPETLQNPVGETRGASGSNSQTPSALP